MVAVTDERHEVPGVRVTARLGVHLRDERADGVDDLQAVTPNGRPKPLAFLRVLAREPSTTLRALRNIRRAFRTLEGAR